MINRNYYEPVNHGLYDPLEILELVDSLAIAFDMQMYLTDTVVLRISKESIVREETKIIPGKRNSGFADIFGYSPSRYWG